MAEGEQPPASQDNDPQNKIDKKPWRSPSSTPDRKFVGAPFGGRSGMEHVLGKDWEKTLNDLERLEQEKDIEHPKKPKE